MLHTYKRSYHPLLIVLFHLSLLDDHLLRQIPYSTRAYWKHMEQEQQFGHEHVRAYMDAQLDIKAVYLSKRLYRFVRFVCRMHDGYSRIANLLPHPQKIKQDLRKVLVETVGHLSQNVRVPVAARIMNISTQKFYRWKSQSECKISKIKKCFRQITHQLSLREIQAISKAMKDPANFGKNKISIYYPLLLGKKIACSLATFYNYCRDENRSLRKPPAKHETLRAQKVFQYLHVDITELICQNGKVLVAFVKDNFSKAILNWKIVPDKSSSHIRDLFADIFHRYECSMPELVSIVSDGGPENKGELLLWIAQQVVPEVKKLTAGVEVKSNSMSESVHHILKAEFLRYQPPGDPHRALVSFERYHNHERYPTEHYGYTCWQVFEGAVPDKHRFKAQLAEGRKRRVEENRKFTCLKGTVCSQK